MNVFGVGTFFTGVSGAGKSELALDLLSRERGHQLIADDTTEFYSPDGKQLLGTAPDLLKNFLEVRGLGVLNISTLFGPNAVKQEQPLSLVIHLQKGEFVSRDITSIHSDTKLILGIPIPHMVLPAIGRLDIRAEVIVRSHIKRITSNDDFAAKQRIKLGIVS